MLYHIKNEFLTAAINSVGAELWGVQTLGQDPVSCLWDGKQELWPRRAPVCFPWCGKIEGGWFEAEGCRYKAGQQHGFVRDLEHILVEKKAERLRFRLEWDGDEVCWPWPFSFETSHTLEGRTLRTACTAVNLSSRAMPVQLGFHPGLRCPFSPEYGIQDYCIRFEKPEISGGTDTLDLTPALFDHDSICFTNLRSDWLQLEERKTGRYLRVYTQGFPYVLLWSRPGIPGWVCIEPWTGYTGPGHMLSERPGTVLLPPGGSFSRVQKIEIAL